MKSFFLSLFLIVSGIGVFPHLSYAQAGSCVIAGSQLVIIGGKAICFPPTTNACPATSGTITIPVSVTRSAIVSPAFFWFDATGVTDSSLTGNYTPFQDVYVSWVFGDTNPSGTGTWAYGSNPGVNSRNGATGSIAGHLYIIPPGGGDQNFTATVMATNGVSTASCNVTVTVYDPQGANGFSGSATTCVGASTTPVAGAGGCPSGATVLQQSNFNTALTSNFGSGKRVLFKCGDTFTGTDYTVTAVKGSIGAYGGCEGTQTNRPIINTASTSSSGAGFVISQSGTVGDIRIADLDCEGAGTGGGCVGSSGSPGKTSYQITLSNLNTTGNSSGYAFGQGAQWALVELVQTNARGIATFLNFNENNPPYTGNTINNTAYTALIGSHISGCGASCGGGTEDVRISTCQDCVLENTDFLESNNTGSDLKLHGGNTNASCCIGSGCAPPCVVSSTFVNTNCFTGIYTEKTMITDNLFGANAGGSGPEFAPQNGGCDERIRNVVFERNTIASTGVNEGQMSWFVGQNVTIRDNVCNIGIVSGNNYNAYCYFFATRGGTTLPIPNPFVSQYQEIYNNSCFMPSGNNSSQACVFAGPGTGTTPPINSAFANTLSYSVGASRSVVNLGSGGGTGNTYGPATTNSSVSPGFINASGTMLKIPDFKPTANYSGGTSVPNWYDALAVQWSPTWDLGAVHH